MAEDINLKDDDDCDVYVNINNGTNDSDCGNASISCSSIRQGMENALDNQTLCVWPAIGNKSYECPGCYGWQYNKSITLRSANNEYIQIDCDNHGPAFFIASTSTIPLSFVGLHRFSFRRCVAYAGGAMFVREVFNVKIADCVFSNSHALGSVGGALYLQGTLNLSLSNNWFEDNSALYDGGAVCIELGNHLVHDQMVIYNNTFINNNTTNSSLLVSGGAVSSI